MTRLSTVTRNEGENHHLTFRVADPSANWRVGPYWRVKRALDATFAYLLLVVLAPLMVLVGMIVAIDVGLPLVFWQQRPGVGGYPFKLYKFRTMTAAHDGNGRSVPANERTSKIGHLLRRLRLDELPQLFQILVWRDELRRATAAAAGRSVPGLCGAPPRAPGLDRLGAGHGRAHHFAGR